MCRVFYPGWEFQRFALAREIRIATLFFKYKKNSKDIVYRPNYKLQMKREREREGKKETKFSQAAYLFSELGLVAKTVKMFRQSLGHFSENQTVHCTVYADFDF